MLETSRTSGCVGRRHSNGRIRVRCQLDRRPAEAPPSVLLFTPGTICSACLKSQLRLARAVAKLRHVPEPLIEREEIVALLFNVADIASAALEIERLLGEEDDGGEEEAHEG